MPDTDTSAPSPEASIARIVAGLGKLTTSLASAKSDVADLADKTTVLTAKIEGDVEADLAPMEQRIYDRLVARFGTMFGSMADGLDGAVAQVAGGKATDATDPDAKLPAPVDQAAVVAAVVASTGASTETVTPAVAAHVEATATGAEAEAAATVAAMDAGAEPDEAGTVASAITEAVTAPADPLIPLGLTA
jgi:hypothetical protein